MAWQMPTAPDVTANGAAAATALRSLGIAG
jgi:hypothetical protein